MIHVPTIMPDEWLNGYLERLIFVNSFKKQKDLVIYLQQHSMFDQNMSMTEIAAFLLNQSVEHITWQHTLIPAIRAFTYRNPYDRHGHKPQKKIFAFNSHRKKRHNPRYCKQCVREDIDYWGFPYFRRSHQLVGSDWCLKHQINLLVNEKSPIPSPKSLMQNINDSQPLSLLSEQHPIIRRYVDIFEGLVCNQFPIPAEHASWVLSEQAIALGLNKSTMKKSIDKRISDIAIEEVPKFWLFNNFSNLKNKQIGQFIPTIDGVTIKGFQNHSTQSYILAAAILFNCADEALNKLNKIREIDKAPKIKEAPLKKSIIRLESFWRSDEMQALYVKHCGSCAFITKEIGGEYQPNLINLRNNGLPPLSNISKETIQAISDFYIGTSILELVKRQDVNIVQLENVIRNAGSKFYSAFNLIKPALDNKALKVKKSTLKKSHLNSTLQDLSTQDSALEVMMQ